jgi:hypothetical protein
MVTTACWTILSSRAVVVLLWRGVRIPGDVDQRSELMSITIPK